MGKVERRLMKKSKETAGGKEQDEG